MDFLKQAERKFGRYAIHNLTLFLVGGQGIALLLGLARPDFLGSLLLFPQAVLAGEWWRLFTFIFTPPAGNPIFAAFALYLLYFMGGALEAQWGALRYNLYVLIGLVMTIAAAFAFPYLPATNVYITGSIFLAFAYLFPDFQIMMFFILPVRVKWLALATWLFYGYQCYTGGLPACLLIAASVANFLLFFGKQIYYKARYGHRQVRKQVRAIATKNTPLHICQVCGMTDKTNPTMDFRYCTKCEPPLAYCQDHLRNHEHVQSPGAPGAQRPGA